MFGRDGQAIAAQSTDWFLTVIVEAIVLFINRHHSRIACGIHFVIEDMANHLLTHAAGALVDVVGLHVRWEEVDLRDYFGPRTLRVPAEDFVFPRDRVRNVTRMVLRLCFGNMSNDRWEIWRSAC